MSLLRAAVAAIALTTVITACGESGLSSSAPAGAAQSSPSPAATRTPLPVTVVANGLFPPSGTSYFGAYVDTSGLVNGNTEADVESVEAVLGRTLSLDMHYAVFTSEFAGRNFHSDFAANRIPFVSWNCGVPNAQIAAGAYDSTIELKAIAARNFGWPVFVRYMWDPNLPAAMLSRTPCYDPDTDLPNKRFSPAQFIAAWDRIHSIFASAGATNVVWVWTISNNANARNDLQYYPGSSEVDWVGMDAYDLNNGSFASTYASTYAELATLDKPILVTETGAQAAVQSSFFTGAAQTLQTQFPLVRGYMYYDGIDYVTGQNQDWRITTSAYQPFITFADDPSLSALYEYP